MTRAIGLWVGSLGLLVMGVAVAQPAPTLVASVFYNMLCTEKTLTVTYEAGACPKGVTKATSRLKPDGTRTVTLTCQP